MYHVTPMCYSVMQPPFLDAFSLTFCEDSACFTCALPSLFLCTSSASALTQSTCDVPSSRPGGGLFFNWGRGLNRAPQNWAVGGGSGKGLN